MRQIIPFKRELLFKTKVSEVTSISLEHTFELQKESIIGQFYINGDYKMTDGSINRESFEFKLPFDISIDSSYDRDTLVVDIDNFYYQIINNDTLQVNIDLYVDYEKIKVNEEFKEEIKFDDLVSEFEEDAYEDDKFLSFRESNDIVIDNNIESNREIEYSKKVYEDIVEGGYKQQFNNKVDEQKEKEDNMVNYNVFDNVNDCETYCSYYVYIMKENDTIDNIFEKYGVSREDALLYNDLENIKTGDKIIIPSRNE